MHRSAGRSYLRVLTDTGFIGGDDLVVVSWEAGSPQGKLMHLAPAVSCCLAASRQQQWSHVLSTAESEVWKVCTCTTSLNTALPWARSLGPAGHTEAWWVAESHTLMRRWERRDRGDGPRESPGKLRLLLARKPLATGHTALDAYAEQTVEQLASLMETSETEPWWSQHCAAIVARGVKTLQQLLAEPSAFDGWTADRLRQLCDAAGAPAPTSREAVADAAVRQVWVRLGDVDHLLSDAFAACDTLVSVHSGPGSPLIGRMNVAAAAACNFGADDVIGPAQRGVSAEQVRAAIPLVSAGVPLVQAVAATLATSSV